MNLLSPVSAITEEIVPKEATGYSCTIWSIFLLYIYNIFIDFW